MRLHGRVRHDGQPIEGAYVQLIGPSGEFTAEVRTDASGRFLFYPAPGEWVLRGLVPGGARLELAVHLDTGQSIEVQLDDADPTVPEQAGRVSDSATP